jgi:hypothetical protein
MGKAGLSQSYFLDTRPWEPPCIARSSEQWAPAVHGREPRMSSLR